MTPTEQVKMLREALTYSLPVHSKACWETLNHLATNCRCPAAKFCAALAATAEPATPETPPVLVGSVDAFCRSQGYVPADDLRKVAEAIKEAALRNGIGVLYGDLDAIIAKAVGK